MRIKIEIECDNAAFHPDPTRELWRILAALGNKLVAWQEDREEYGIKLAGGIEFKLADHNGITVGTFKVEEPR